ncbi:FAD-binding protein [Bradyrhizobium sp. AS23.2]|uniref:FAD-binding protein n=1 Tax=Bradyrhizobium sp. AS23.2 TaxID=1680155 RepID=UPI000AC2081E|nr:FAD-binding protein [Bradyrhizobium sp. AS23.2]
MDNMVRNYDGGITSSPARLVSPSTVPEIQSILTDAVQYPGPVRAKGSFHSLTPCVSSDGTIIDMSRMNRILKIDPHDMTFTAEAGLQFIAASRVLKALNLQFMTNIEIGNMTLGAAACCHTKDGLDGGEFGQVGSYITAMKWVTPSGQLAEASEANNPALMYLMRSSYGLCGIVYEVTFRIKPLEVIHFKYLPRPIGDLTEKEVDEIIDASRGLICWTVGRKAHFQTRHPADRVGPFGSLFAASRRKLWNFGEARVGRFIDSSIPTKPLREASLDTWFVGNRLLMSYLHLVGGATLYNPDKTIDYSETRPSARYAFTFWAFPRAAWLKVLRDYVDFSEKYFRDHDFRCNMALGSYFIRKDEHSMLSYSHDGDVFSVDPIHAYTDRPAWDGFLKEFNEFASKRGGIPLLNQSPFITKSHVEAAYGTRWINFSAQVRQADPQGRMLNPFFADLLSP